MSVQRSPTFLAAAGALLVVGGLQAPVALAGARSSSCAAIEASEGPPLLVVPDGATPALEPQDVLDRIASGTHLRRAGHGPASAIPCLEYVPADPGAPANSVAGRAVWSRTSRRASGSGRPSPPAAVGRSTAWSPSSTRASRRAAA